jgi:hypothetical protein
LKGQFLHWAAGGALAHHRYVSLLIAADPAYAMQVYSYIGPQAERKRKGDNVAIVVAGCVAQQVEG